MYLMQPLAVESGRIHKIDLTNTEDGVTVVLLIQALCTQATADLIGLGWLFDENGNLQPFSGTVGGEGELSGPDIAMLTRGGAKNMNFKASKVAHFRVTKDKEDAVLSMRVHLPKADDDGILSYLKQLLRIKKSEMDLTVTDAQGVLFDGRDGAPAEPVAPIAIKFHAEAGRKGEVLACIFLHHDKANSRWFYGFELEWRGPGSPPKAALILNTDGTSFKEDREAATAAAADLIATFLKDQTAGYSAGQLQASAACMDWLLANAPSLRKDANGKPYAVPPPKVAPPAEELPSGPPAGKRAGAGRRGPREREQVH